MITHPLYICIPVLLLIILLRCRSIVLLENSFHWCESFLIKFTLAMRGLIDLAERLHPFSLRLGFSFRNSTIFLAIVQANDVNGLGIYTLILSRHMHWLLLIHRSKHELPSRKPDWQVVVGCFIVSLHWHIVFRRISCCCNS